MQANGDNCERRWIDLAMYRGTFGMNFYFKPKVRHPEKKPLFFWILLKLPFSFNFWILHVYILNYVFCIDCYRSADHHQKQE